ncbi:hypothetical protein P3T27_005451 [Kitasatospora sp. MAA19]|nr:hypothetical protein [Kitasatospora sp. MAA19]
MRRPRRLRVTFRAGASVGGQAVEAYVERAATHAERWSDHAPVTAAYDHES